VSASIVQILPELCQAWCRDIFPREPVSVPYNPLGEEPFPTPQPDPPLSIYEEYMAGHL